MSKSKHIEDLARIKVQRLKHAYDEDDQAKHGLIHEIDETILALEGQYKSATKTDKKTPKTDMSAKDIQAHIKALLADMKSEKKALLHYQDQLADSKYIVISNWSLNDLSDSNNDLISDTNLATWRTIGCKVYGKAGGDKSLNRYDNKGYFATFNYPINIVKAPNIYFYDQSELKDLYDTIKAHNPTLSKYLVAMAKAGTIPVYKFKQLFGLTTHDIKARLAKARQDAQNDIPDPSISKLENYYKWELRQRKEYDRNQSDLSGYDSDYETQSDFSDNEKGYHENGNQDYDVSSDLDDPNHLNDYTDSDLYAGMDYDDTESDLDDSDIDEDDRNDIDPYDTEYHGE